MPLSPVDLLASQRSLVWPQRVAVRHGELAFTYAQFEARCRRLASALARRGIGYGDTVAKVMAPNARRCSRRCISAVPALGAVLNALNVRQDARTLAFCLRHGDAKVLITDAEFAPAIKAALAHAERDVLVVDIDDPQGPPGERLGELTYEALLAEGDPEFAWPGVKDEWDALSLLYTSGTTGDPKGVVYHHRGAYLNALGNALAFRLDADSVYLWTLPMFHCNGWTYPWAVTAAGGTHVCLRRVEAARVFAAIRDFGVTHLCGAPVVLNLLIHAPDAVKVRPAQVVNVATGGAAPPSAVIEAMEAMGFRVTHLYGLTESYGPATLCAWQAAWGDLPLTERALMMARQGVPMPTLAGVQVGDPATGAAVPRDGATIGEVMLRGNTIMKGYLENPAATDAARSPAAGSAQATSVCGTRTATSRSRTAAGRHHHLGRREHQLARSGGMPVPASAGDGGRRGRAARRALGRDAVRVRHAAAGRRRRRRGIDRRMVPRASRSLQGAAHGRVRPVAEDGDRQDPEVRAAREPHLAIAKITDF